MALSYLPTAVQPPHCGPFFCHIGAVSIRRPAMHKYHYFRCSAVQDDRGPVPFLSYQGIEHIKTIPATVLGERLFCESSETGRQIDRTDKFIAHTRLNPAFPASDERGSRAPLHKRCTYHQNRGREARCFPDFFQCTILVAIVEHRTHCRSRTQPAFFSPASVDREFSSTPPTHPVKLYDGIAAKSE